MRKIIMALIATFVILGTVGVANAFTIKNNSVYIDTSNVYISAEPHTLRSSGYVTFTIQPRKYTGNVNIIWGFNTTQTIPKSAELYNPHNVSWNTSNSYFVPNVNGYWETTKPCEIGNSYNTYKREVNYTLVNGTNSTTEQKVFCFDSWVQDGNNYTLTWHTEHTKLIEWTDVSQYISSIDYNYDGKNKWYYATNLPVTAGNTYILRSYVKVPINSQGKYDFAIYPSSYGTNIGQAISNGHFYYLDPWWNSLYFYRRNTTNTSASYDFLYPFVDEDPDGDSSLSTYYGQHGAIYYNSDSDWRFANDTTERCGFSTFEDSVKSNVRHCTTPPNGLDAYWTLDNDSIDVLGNYNGTLTGSPIPLNASGIVKNAFTFNGGDGTGYYSTSYRNPAQFTWAAWIKTDYSGGTAKNIIGTYDHTTDGAALYMSFIGTAILGGRGGGSYVSSGGGTTQINDSNWHFIVGKQDSTTMYIYVDGVLESSDNTGTTAVPNQDFNIGIDGYLSGSGYWNGSIDDIRVYNYSMTDAEIQYLYNITKPITGFDPSFGFTVTSSGGTSTSFNITLIGETPVASNGTTSNIEFNSTGATDSQVEPCVVSGSCQSASSSLSIFEFKNTGNVNLNWTVCINDSMPSSINIKCGGTNVYSSASAVPVCSSGNLTLQSNIATSSTVKGYCWSDFTTALASDTTSRAITHSSVQS